MDYKKLTEAHKLFYEGEYRAFNYDGYMKCKDCKSWMDPDLPGGEVRKLFNFIKSWDRFFRGDHETFREIYRAVYSTLQELKNERIEDTNFTEEQKEHYRDIGKRWNMKIYLSKAFVSKIVTDLVRWKN